jgi:hypothetical protein
MRRRRRNGSVETVALIVAGAAGVGALGYWIYLESQIPPVPPMPPGGAPSSGAPVPGTSGGSGVNP